MARAPCRRAPLGPALVLVLVLAALPSSARVHVQSMPADAGPTAGQSAGEGDYQGHQVLKVYVSDNATLDLLRDYEGNPGES